MGKAENKDFDLSQSVDSLSSSIAQDIEIRRESDFVSFEHQVENIKAIGRNLAGQMSKEFPSPEEAVFLELAVIEDFENNLLNLKVKVQTGSFKDNEFLKTALNFGFISGFTDATIERHQLHAMEEVMAQHQQASLPKSRCPDPEALSSFRKKIAKADQFLIENNNACGVESLKTIGTMCREMSEDAFGSMHYKK